MSDVEQGFNGSVFEAGLDSDNDGIKSVTIKLFLTEAMAEAFKKGDSIEGAKVANFKFEGMEMVIDIDTDRDGEPVLSLRANLGEAFDEASKRI